MEKQGFSWSESGPSFKRKRGDLTDEVKFARSKWNRADVCEFWSTWAVRSKAFRSWYQNVWSKAPSDNYLVVTNDWLIPGWPRSASGFTIHNEPRSDAKEMKVLIDAFTVSGMAFLDQHSTPAAAAEFWLQRKARMDRPIDLLVMSGQKERAEELYKRLIAEARAFGGPATAQYVAGMRQSAGAYFANREL
jgi:hypothetical protein